MSELSYQQSYVVISSIIPTVIILLYTLPIPCLTSLMIPSNRWSSETDELWKDTREPPAEVIQRGVDMMKWLASRPETEIAVVAHSSYLKHLFRAFGQQIESSDKQKLHRLSGNAEVRSISLASHHGFYPEGEWEGDTNVFIPTNPSFRKGKWAPTNDQIVQNHVQLQS